MPSFGIRLLMLGKGFMLPCRSSNLDSFGTLVWPVVSRSLRTSWAAHKLFTFRVSIRTGVHRCGKSSPNLMFYLRSRSLHRGSVWRVSPPVARSAPWGLTLGYVPFAIILLRPHCMLFETLAMLARRFLWLISLPHLLAALCRAHSPGWKMRPLNYLV
ncbi:hypothetical protein V6N12_050361 [Hibiscus sabdariffa]|uniref:Uncharacterized protein n=1 Tax=Hibiscus sabdariffa TaxID=183260 RepID=A0ABR2GC60_9ROSI